MEVVSKQNYIHRKHLHFLVSSSAVSIRRKSVHLLHRNATAILQKHKLKLYTIHLLFTTALQSFMFSGILEKNCISKGKTYI